MAKNSGRSIRSAARAHASMSWTHSVAWGLFVLILVAACTAQRSDEDDENPVDSVSSALSVATRYQAETMPWSGTDGVDGEVRTDPSPTHRYFWENGSAWQDHNFAGGSTTITVRGAGDLLDGIGPHVVVSVDGAAIGNGRFDATAYASKAYTFTATAGVHRIKVQYDNDDEQGGADRNLLLDWIEVAETSSSSCWDASYEAENMPWSGVENVDGEVRATPAPKHRYFWKNGYVSQNHSFVAGPARIRIHAQGESYEGVGPHVVVSVGGTDIGGGYINGSGFLDKVFPFTATAGMKEVRVRYDNDDWTPPGDATEDRNLLLDRVDVLCGATATDAGADSGSDSGGAPSDAGGGSLDASGTTDAGGGTADGGGGAACTPASCDDRLPCATGTCGAGRCIYTAVANGTACSDGNLCTAADTCLAGQCVSGIPVTPTPSSACMVATCDPILGILQTPAPNGTACADGNVCNGSETCDVEGACVLGTAPTIDDGNPCTDDACDPVAGVRHTPRAAGDLACSDHDACNGEEACNGAGACVAGAPPAIDDGNLCTTDSCSAIAGPVHTPIAQCDPTPIRGDGVPFETRASLIGQLVTSRAPATGVTFSVTDVPAPGASPGAPRSDVTASVAGDGSFRLRLTSFRDAEADRTPPLHVILRIESPSFLTVFRDAWLHTGDAVDLGPIHLFPRDAKITNIGPAGGTATDSQNRIQVVIPPGALTTTIPVQITPVLNRDDMPTPLPASTPTLYGYILDPVGTEFASPVTVRISNYRNVPTSFKIPVGIYDEVHGRWDHEAVAAWDGSAFAYQTSRFSDPDCNSSAPNDLVIRSERNPSPDRGKDLCGSRLGLRGGSVGNDVALPTYQVRTDTIGVTLEYESGLAAGRTFGAAPSNVQAVPHASAHGVAVSSPKITAFCVPRGSSGGAGTGSGAPGTCSQRIPGGCSLGAGGGGVQARDFTSTMTLAGSSFTSTAHAVATTTELEFDGHVQLPLSTESGAATAASSGLFPAMIRIAVSGSGGASCVSGGTASPPVFGVSPSQPADATQTNLEEGPLVETDTRVLVHHRTNSPFGAGWAISEVSRVYAAGDEAFLVDGRGQVERFLPRANGHYTGYTQFAPSLAMNRDARTGEIFAATGNGRLDRLDGATATPSTVLSGLGTSTVFDLAIAYVGSQRHFVVAAQDSLVDYDASGSRRVLATRAAGDVDSQPHVAARNDRIFYSDGNGSALYTASLADAAPTLAILSGTTDPGLYPKKPLGDVQFKTPQGLAFDANGVLWVADSGKNAVYTVQPGPTGTVGATSRVDLAVGDGAGRNVSPRGEHHPGPKFSIHEPFHLSFGEDGKLLMGTTLGVAVYDPLANEAMWLLLFGGRDELTYNPRAQYSLLALNGTSTFMSTIDGNTPIFRFDVDLLSSEYDPTRRFVRAADGTLALTDTTAALVERYDTDGRIVARSHRTGELIASFSYKGAHTNQLDRITDAVGGQTSFSYNGQGKLESITDARNRITRIAIDDQGDLKSVTVPEGETYAFGYAEHRMTTRTSPKGDVTSYAYHPDGSIASTTRPEGAVTTIDAALSNPAVSSAQGTVERHAHYTDPHGVAHDVVSDAIGQVTSDTYVVDGVTRVETTTYDGDLVDHTLLRTGVQAPSYPSTRKNKLLRVQGQFVNGVPTRPLVNYDAHGRPWRQYVVQDLLTLSYSAERHWFYDDAGWLLNVERASFASTGERFERDAQGHLTGIYDLTGDAPSGREVHWTYRPDGLVATATDPYGVLRTFTYDDAGGTQLELGWTDTVGRSMKYSYDAAGNVASTSDGTATEFAKFDGKNRLVETKDAIGNATSYGYGHAGCSCSQEELLTSLHTPDLPAGVDWQFDYDGEGRLKTVTDPLGFTERYGYEPTGEIKTFTDRKSRTTTTTHDALGRVKTMLDTLGRAHAQTYPVPVAGTPTPYLSSWVGPALLDGSGDGTPGSTSLTSPLRNGEYQIGSNAFRAHGMPAIVSLYRDATFELGYSHTPDVLGRPVYVADRIGKTIDSVDPPSAAMPSSSSYKLFSWSPFTESPLLTNITSNTRFTGFTQNLQFDDVKMTWPYGTETTTRDGAGRLTKNAPFVVGPNDYFDSYATELTYRPDGRVATVSDADGATTVYDTKTNQGSVLLGSHAFSYDERGLVSTSTAFEGTYQYAYDALGRNTEIDYPDGHRRVQGFDDLGRVTSRCYVYPDGAAPDRCYGASYDGVGNPIELRDPEGTDTISYDALDRLTRVSRNEGGVTTNEEYAYNALGALSQNAGVQLDHQRPRLDGAGKADAAVPATLAGQDVVLDRAGRVTTLKGADFTWDSAGILSSAGGTPLAFDHTGRRTWTGGLAEFYLYSGPNRLAQLEQQRYVAPPGRIRASYLYAGIDHPLRIASSSVFDTGPVGQPVWHQRPELLAYYEVDLTGNVRRLRAAGGRDLGGYRYSAFGKTVEDTVVNEGAAKQKDFDLTKQPFRWKGRPRETFGGVELYDMRARWWSPEMGGFLTIDEYAFHDRVSTLWGWPRQNPLRWSDPFGRDAQERSEFNRILFDLDDNGYLNATAGFGTGLLDNVPLYAGIPGANVTLGDVASWAGLDGRHSARSVTQCANGGDDDDAAEKSRIAGAIVGGLLLGAAEEGASALSKQAQKGIRSLEKRIAEHEAKLADFRANPTVRPGMENQAKEVIEAAQQSRIDHLEREIQTFRDNIDKLRKGM